MSLAAIKLTLIAKRVLKYIVEGLAVAMAAYYIPRKKMQLNEIMSIAIAAAAVFAVIDVLAPSIGESVRAGMGIGIGAMTVL